MSRDTLAVTRRSKGRTVACVLLIEAVIGVVDLGDTDGHQCLLLLDGGQKLPVCETADHVTAALSWPGLVAARNRCPEEAPPPKPRPRTERQQGRQKSRRTK